MKSKNFEIWVLPRWAATRITETLPLDAESSFFGHELREDIRNALSKIESLNHFKVSALLNTIKQETRPIEGHTDPGAIEDCWNELMEMLEIDEQ